VEQTLIALSKNELANQSVIYIYCDGPKENATEEQINNIKQTREVVRKEQWCKEVNIIESDKNKGLADSIIGGVTDVVNKYGKVIVLEDDIITSKGFLNYMNEALEVYSEESSVMHITAYMYPHKCKLPETFFYQVPYPGGGWATWKRAWNLYNNNTDELYNKWKDRWDEFDIFGCDTGEALSKQLIANYNGTLKTWFVKWHATLLENKGLTLYPGKSLTNNIGFDNSGSNCFETKKFQVAITECVSVERLLPKINKKASRVIYDFHNGHWYNKRRRIKLINKILSFIHLPIIKK
jgi:hypothetical protein